MLTTTHKRIRSRLLLAGAVLALPLSVWVGVAPSARAEQAPAKSAVILETEVFDSSVDAPVGASVSSHRVLVDH